MRNPNIQFPTEAATWRRSLRTLTVPYEGKDDGKVNSGITTVDVHLTDGSIQVEGIVPQKGISKKPSLTAELRIKALTEKRARRKLEKLRKGISITNTSDGIEVIQEKDMSFPPTLANFYSTIGAFLYAVRTKEFTYFLEDVLMNASRLDVSLQVPHEQILYSLETEVGDVSVAKVQGKQGSTVYTGMGEIDLSQNGGNFSISGGEADVSVTHHTGSVDISIIEGDIATSEIIGDVNVIIDNLADPREIAFDDVIGDVNITINEGDVIGKDLTGGLFVQIEEGNIDAEQIIGGLHASITKGHITVRDLTGTLQAKSEDGRIDIFSADIVGVGNYAKTGEGDINLTVVNNDLRVHALVEEGTLEPGDFHVDVKVSDADFVDVSAHIGSQISPHAIELKTKSGDIFLSAEAEE